MQTKWRNVYKQTSWRFVDVLNSRPTAQKIAYTGQISLALTSLIPWIHYQLTGCFWAHLPLSYFVGGYCLNSITHIVIRVTKQCRHQRCSKCIYIDSTPWTEVDSCSRNVDRSGEYGEICWRRIRHHRRTAIVTYVVSRWRPAVRRGRESVQFSVVWTSSRGVARNLIWVGINVN